MVHIRTTGNLITREHLLTGLSAQIERDCSIYNWNANFSIFKSLVCTLSQKEKEKKKTKKNIYINGEEKNEKANYKQKNCLDYS